MVVWAALRRCKQGINFFDAPAAHLLLHPPGHLPGLAAVFRLLAQQGENIVFRAALHLFRRPDNNGYLAEQVIGQAGAVLQSGQYKFLVLLGQFPANRHFTGAKQPGRLGEAFLEPVAALKKYERAGELVKGGKKQNPFGGPGSGKSWK